MKIVTIGGGTGAPLVIKALIKAGFKNIQSITASMDSGGRTGIVRSDERDKIIAVSDLLRTQLEMIHPRDVSKPQVQAFIELSAYTDGRYRNTGYMLYYALLEKYHNDFEQVKLHIERLLKIKFYGTAIPVSLDPSHIYFSTQSGATYHGEHELDRFDMSRNMVTKIWLEPKATATQQALSAIKNADIIIYSPGSIYGSVLSNFLPQGISQAMQNSHAQKILITNLVSSRNQTHKITPNAYWKLFQTYTHTRIPFNYIICPDISFQQFNDLYPQTAANYESVHSYFLGWGDSEFSKLKKQRIKIIRDKIYIITPKLKRVRHDSDKLATLLKNIITVGL